MQPAELLIAKRLNENDGLASSSGLNIPTRSVPNWYFDFDVANELLCRQFNTKNLVAYGCQDFPLAVSAAGALLQYTKDMQYDAMPHINDFGISQKSDYLIIDAASRQNLEIETNLSGGREFTLVALMDKCANPMGARLLRRWLHGPITDHQVISQRQLAVSEFIESLDQQKVHELLRKSGDIERILTRIALNSARPRDLVRLRTALHCLPAIEALLKGTQSDLINNLAKTLGPFSQAQTLLDDAIADEPAAVIRDGGVIRPEFDSEFQELHTLSKNSGDFLVQLEQREREQTGISTLKVKYNRVHGFYIEVGKAQALNAPEHYIRRQTLKNAERYITEELKEYEDKVLSAREKSLAREKFLYQSVLDQLQPDLSAMQLMAQSLASLDVLCNFAERAISLNFCRPKLVNEPGIEIIAGRHPVVEEHQSAPFIANDLVLNAATKMRVITGPNMGGKSTFMRQNALIVLLAYIGSFVPATEARIGPVDRIFTRIGASDDLASGQSTFMVEMTEAAHILHNATPSSVVLMDEIGRGTSTYDGLSLASACAEHLSSVNNAMSLFATHYFELTALSEKHANISNVHLDAMEHNGKIVFMHQIKSGAANRSYGIQVAMLAGLPERALLNARALLAELEQQADTLSLSTTPENTKTSAANVQSQSVNSSQNSNLLHKDSELPLAPQLDLFSQPDEMSQYLSRLDIDEISPKQALNHLYELKQLVKS